MSKLSVVTIAKNEAGRVAKYLETVRFADEIILVDNGSTDDTVDRIRKSKAKIYQNPQSNLGKLKNYALQKANCEWILLLDVDEVPSQALIEEIKAVVRFGKIFSGYRISYQNYFLGHPLVCRAQEYTKVRLFKKQFGSISKVPVHEEVIIKGNIGQLKGIIHHYSFVSMPQVIRKFTDYARRESAYLYASGLRTNLKHLVKYPAHMFWTVFITDEGFKDQIWGLLLALSFTYYEFMRYLFLLKYSLLEFEKN